MTTTTDVKAIRKAWAHVPDEIADTDTVMGSDYTEAARDVLALCDELETVEGERDRMVEYLGRWQKWAADVAHHHGWCDEDTLPDDTKMRERIGAILKAHEGEDE